MGEKYQKYHAASYRLPEKSFAWNLYGAGMESMGRDGKPEPFAIPEPTDDQLLVRIDTVSICFSDVKILKQGGSHPKLSNRNLAVDPPALDMKSRSPSSKLARIWRRITNPVSVSLCSPISIKRA